MQTVLEEVGKKAAEDVEAKKAREGKYLTFSLEGEEYGIEILKIREIIGMMSITGIPRTPPYVKGVINLRGKVIPVIDLRLKFEMEELPYTDRTCIVVVDIRKAERMNILMGIIVDSVSEVVNIRGDEIENTPDFGTSLTNENFLGVAKIKGAVKVLLDIDRVLTSEADVAGSWVQ